jgi:phosphoribosyl-ATP pyrophosphohydrolase
LFSNSLQKLTEEEKNTLTTELKKNQEELIKYATCFPLYYIVMRAERPILLRFLNVLTSLNRFIIKRIVFLFCLQKLTEEEKNTLTTELKKNQEELIKYVS